ncbi:MAG: acyl-CoA synthetase [Hyphomicrobiaceae bacterium]
MSIDLPFGIARNTSYDVLFRDFKWEVPATFNFATDVVDMWANERDKPALIWENENGDAATYTFSEIAAASRRLANVLVANGLNKGDRILLMMPRIPEWQIAMLACFRVGAIAIPCIEMLTAGDLAYRIENSGATAVICRSQHVEKFTHLMDRIPIRIAIGSATGWLDYAVETAMASDLFDPVVTAAEDPVVMYYTSGSTGHPKGVLHAARALFSWRYAALYWLDLEPDDRIWCTADIGWSKAGTSVLFGPWSCGSCAYFFDGPFDPADRLERLSRHEISIYCAPATELNRLVDEPIATYDLSQLRRTISAGEPMNPAVAKRWQAATGIEVSEAYGQTEALMMVLNYPGMPVKIGSMGKPQPGMDIDIIDDNGERLGANAEGHIATLMPNPQVMLRYWQDPEQTSSLFLQGPDGTWCLSGDRAWKDDDNYFWFAGRADDVITSAGYRIGPLEVENALLAHDAVLECAVVGKPNRDRGEIVKAFIVLRPGIQPSDDLAAELQAHAKSITAPYKYPREITFQDSLPKTITGKIRRRELRDLERQATATDT